MVRLYTKNYFIDTSIFEENNFLHGTKVQSLFEYSNKGVVNLFMTKISRMELIKRYHKRIVKCKEDYHEFIRLFNKKDFRVLKNLKDYENLRPISIDVDYQVEIFKEKLDRNVKASNIHIISGKGVSIDDIYSLYFDEAPPFGTGNKKCEFPDAFILKAIENWCLNKKKRMVVISKDTDFKKYKSPKIVFREDLGEELNKISKYYDTRFKKNLLTKIESFLTFHEHSILTKIKYEIEDAIETHIDYDFYSDLNLSAIKYHKYQVLSLTREYIEVQYFVNLIFNVIRHPSTDEHIVNIEEKSLRPHKIKFEKIVPVDMEIHDIVNPEVKIKWVNNNKPVKIELYKKIG